VVRVVSNLTRQEIESCLRTFGAGGDGADVLARDFKRACKEIAPKTIYEKWDAEINRVLAEGDYPAALRYYKTKGLHADVGSVLGLKYQDQIMRWLRSKDADALVAAFRAAIPSFPSPGA
jgi:hypothetical protein